MPSGIDWPAIRQKFEQGISQRSLAREYGVSQPTISERAKNEGWIKRPITLPITPLSDPINDREPDDLLAIIATLLQKVAHHAQQDELEPKTIKLLADAISQFHKIKLTSPESKPTASGTPSDLLPYLDNYQLRELARLRGEEEAILEEARAKKLEHETGIMSIKRTG